MIDDDCIPVAAYPSGRDDPSALGRVERLPGVAVDVDAGVEAAPAGAVGRGHRPVEGPDEAMCRRAVRDDALGGLSGKDVLLDACGSRLEITLFLLEICVAPGDLGELPIEGAPLVLEVRKDSAVFGPALIEAALLFEEVGVWTSSVARRRP